MEHQYTPIQDEFRDAPGPIHPLGFENHVLVQALPGQLNLLSHRLGRLMRQV